MTDHGPVVVLGGFDGFHSGHRRRIGAARAMAERQATGLVAVVVDNCRPWLMSPENRCTAVLGAGAQSAFVHQLERHQSPTASARFAEMLADRFRPSLVVIGERTSSGSGRRVPNDLRRDFGAVGVTVETIGQSADGVTSDRLGEYVATGSFERYTADSVAPYSIGGVVELGDQRGRTIGFPTANIRPNARQRLPSNGVYAGIVRVGRRDYVSAINIGVRPTFYTDETRPLVEAHLIGYEGDLYDSWLTVQLETRLRGERRFESIQDLVAQLGLDVAQARAGHSASVVRLNRMSGTSE